MRMQSIIKTSCGAALVVILVGCGDTEGGFTSSGSTGTNIPSAAHFSLASSEAPAAEVFTGTLADSSTWVWEVDHEVDISITVGDNKNIKVNGGTVHFAVDYGLLSAANCTLDNGSCSIKWYSEGFSQAPLDNYATITAWMIGEESYYDINDSGNFDDGDIQSTDTAEPFLDINHNGTFDTGIDVLIDIDNNSTFTPADGLFNGQNCTHSTLCSPTTRIPIYDILYMNMDART
ncbi:MAG: hypothetical protein HYZ31_09875 [Gammaproteobacteria bacterium]|nr:hypothetical protein [Gammaproteobacteria bacterium]